MPFGNVGRVWALFNAYGDHRTFEMLELLHPDIVWIQPGPTEYRGHDGVRQMLAEQRQTTGSYSIHLDDVTEDGPGAVIARGQVIPTGAHHGTNVTWKVHLLGGLVRQVETVLNDGSPGQA